MNRLFCLLAIASLAATLNACGEEDEPRFVIDFDVNLDADLDTVDGGDITPDGTTPRPDTDTPGPQPCNPPCDVLGRTLCGADGVCGPCNDGLAATAGTGSICCAPGEVASSDGLSCEVAPECDDVRCYHGGACVVVAGVGVCDCPEGTSGRQCDLVCRTEVLTPTACSIDGLDCRGLFDDTWEFNPSCSNDSPVCERDGGECANGCIRFAIDLDMGREVRLDELLWRADWWTKRPERVIVQVSDAPSYFNAETVAELTGVEAPYQCVAGEPCADNVPNDCCLDGRDQPQRLADGDPRSLLDIHPVENVGFGQYWRIIVDSTYFESELNLSWMQTRGDTCPGGLACDPARENCGPEPTSVYRVLEIGSTDWDSAASAASDDVINGVWGQLASITSARESEEVTEMMRRIGRPIWFGLYQETGAQDYAEPDRGWRWLSGEPFEFENWGGGEPNDSGDFEHWGLLLDNGAWNDQSFTSPANAVGALVEFPYEQLEPAINPDNSNAYLRVSGRFIDFGDAENHARSLWFRGAQGHLVTVTSPSEHQWISDNLGWGYLWIGMYQDLSAGDYSEPGGGWRWVTGEPIAYTNWGDGEPNNASRDGENFVSTNDGGEWNDNVQNWDYNPRNEGYIVEFELDP